MVFLVIYSMILYFISVPTTVFPILAMIAIFKFSDKYDLEYKILNMLFYICSLIFSIVLTLGLTPYVITPCLGILPLGVLNIFRVSTTNQLVLLILLFSGKLMTIVMLSFYRLSVLNLRKSILYTTSARSVVYFYFLVHFIAIIPFMLMDVENNSQIKSACRQKVSIISDSYFFDEHTIIFQSLDSKVLTVFYLFICVSSILILAAILALLLYTRGAVARAQSALSTETLSKYKVLSDVLYIQTVPSLLTLALLVFIILVVSVLDVSFFAMSYFIHLFVIFVSFSGSYIACQHIHSKPEYRRGLLSLLGLSNSVSHTIYASSRRQSTISIINT